MNKNLLVAHHSKEKDGVKAMFDAIAPHYDLLNHILSLGIDRGWRKLLTIRLARIQPLRVIDVATGTADLAILVAKETHALVTGADISPGMITIGRNKVANAGLSERITLIEADSANLPLENDFFDAATVAFGVRNFENTVEGLTGIFRVIRPGGMISVLEFSSPRGVMGVLARFYMRRLMPLIGGIISGHPSAYTYLPETALTFPEGEGFAALLREAGFNQISITPLTFGIATLYEGYKPTVK